MGWVIEERRARLSHIISMSMLLSAGAARAKERVVPLTDGRPLLGSGLQLRMAKESALKATQGNLRCEESVFGSRCTTWRRIELPFASVYPIHVWFHAGRIDHVTLRIPEDRIPAAVEYLTRIYGASDALPSEAGAEVPADPSFIVHYLRSRGDYEISLKGRLLQYGWWGGPNKADGLGGPDLTSGRGAANDNPIRLGHPAR